MPRRFFFARMLGSANYMAVRFCHCDERSIFHENKEISFPAALGGYGVQLLTATAFAAAPAEEENSFFDFLLGKKYTYLYAALTWDEYWANEKVYAAGSTAASAQLDSTKSRTLAHLTRSPAQPSTTVCTAAASRALP